MQILPQKEAKDNRYRITKLNEPFKSNDGEKFTVVDAEMDYEHCPTVDKIIPRLERTGMEEPQPEWVYDMYVHDHNLPIDHALDQRVGTLYGTIYQGTWNSMMKNLSMMMSHVLTMIQKVFSGFIRFKWC
jgi:hypothetical protein